MSSRFSRWIPAALLIVPFAFELLIPAQAHAITLADIESWEPSIHYIADVLSGPVASSMVLIGFIGGICSFWMCGEINGFSRTMVVMALSGSMLLTVKSCISSLFGV